MALCERPAQTIPKALYTVRHGVTGMRLTKPLATLVEANAAAPFSLTPLRLYRDYGR